MDADCLHGFPATVVTLACEQSVCVARNPYRCERTSPCREALTTCVANRCAHGAAGAPCTIRADCGIGVYCSERGICLPGYLGTSCSKTSAVQCADGLTCADNGMCVPGIFNARCVLDRNCGIGLYCEGGRCTNGDKRAAPIFFPWETPPPMHLAPPVKLLPLIAESVFASPTAEPTNELLSIETPEPCAMLAAEATRNRVKGATLTAVDELSELSGSMESSRAQPAQNTEKHTEAPFRLYPDREEQYEPSTSEVVEYTAVPIPSRIHNPAESVDTKTDESTKATHRQMKPEQPFKRKLPPTAIPIPEEKLVTKKDSMTHIIVRG